MSDDQSFYEIQLNTPHLVLTFLGAAVLGLGFFWLGVVIGRGQTEAGPAGEWQGAIPAGDAADTEEEPFDFYDAVGEPSGQEPAATPTNPADPPVTEATPPPVAAAQPEDRGFSPADPVDEQLAPVVAESAGGLPRPDASLASGWIVQVRATPEKPEADSLQSSLVAAGFPAFVVSADVSGVTWYRVRVGRYRSKNEADVVEAELRTRPEVETTWVTEG